MAMKDKLHTGELYLPGDEEIMRDQLKRLDRLYDFNRTRPTEMDKRQALMKEMFAEIGEGCYSIRIRRQGFYSLSPYYLSTTMKILRFYYFLSFS